MKPILPAAVAFLLSPFASAAAEGVFVDVIATGAGMAQDEAMKAANRAAVEQVVGDIISSKTLVENGDIVEDRILSYSSGFVVASKIVGTPKVSPDGFVTVKVLATVKKTALQEKLAAEKLVSAELDGTSLWAAAVSAEEQLHEAEAMIGDVLGKRSACIVVETVPGKNGRSPLDRDPKSGEATISVRVRLDPARYRAFVREVSEKIGPMAESKVQYQGRDDDVRSSPDGRQIRRIGQGDDGRPRVNYWFKPPSFKGRLLDTKNVFVVVDDLRSKRATAYLFDDNVFAAIEESCGKRPAIRVSLLDGARNVLDARTQCVLTGDQNLCVLCRTDGRIGYPCAAIPLCGGKFDYDGQMIDAFGADPWTDRVLRVPMGVYPVEELKQIAKVEVEFGYEEKGVFEAAPVQAAALPPLGPSSPPPREDGPDPANARPPLPFLETVQPAPRPAEQIPPDLKPIHAVLSDMRGSGPNKKDLVRVATLWKELPAGHRERLGGEIFPLTCAGFLAIGDQESFAKARGRIADMEAFGQETLEACPGCGGRGSTVDRCGACGGRGVCPRCRGSGALRAPRLGGMGSPASMSCSACGGSGRCAECDNGKEAVRHAACGGTGRVVSPTKCREAFRRHLEGALQLICL